jgi:hypothetical protein
MTTLTKQYERVDPPAQATTPATDGSSHNILEPSRERAHSSSAKAIISSSPVRIQIGRFSTGMECVTATPSDLRPGRFSDGQALPLTASPDHFGSFADGQVARPATGARLRVGSFGDGYDTAAARAHL